MKKLLKKILFYIGGLFILAIGINISKTAQLGISPVSAIPYAFELIWGIDLGKSTTIVYISLILLQILILRKDYNPVQLLQILCTYFTGIFITYTGTDYLLSWLPIPTHYFMKLIYSFVSIIFIGTGVSLYLMPDFIPLPPEGLVNAIVKLSKGKLKFSNVKIAVDSSLVIISAILSLVFLGGLKSVREGTILAALLSGKIIGFISKNFKQGFVDWMEEDLVEAEQVD